MDDDIPVVKGTPQGVDLRARLAEALDQRLSVPSLSVFYKVSLVLMLGVALVLPIFYLLIPLALSVGALAFLAVTLPSVRGIYPLIFVLGAGMGMLVAPPAWWRRCSNAGRRGRWTAWWWGNTRSRCCISGWRSAPPWWARACRTRLS